MLKCVKNTVESCQGDLHTILALHSAALNRTPCSNIGLLEDRIGLDLERNVSERIEERDILERQAYELMPSLLRTNYVYGCLMKLLNMHTYIFFMDYVVFFCRFLIGIAEAASCSHVNSI